jgi:hypothetical protein
MADQLVFLYSSDVTRPNRPVDARGDWAAYRTELLDYDTTMKAAAYLAISSSGPSVMN